MIYFFVAHNGVAERYLRRFTTLVRREVTNLKGEITHEWGFLVSEDRFGRLQFPAESQYGVFCTEISQQPFRAAPLCALIPLAS